MTSYRLRAWIDESVDTNKLNEKSYSYKFRVNVNNSSSNLVSLDTSGANNPELTSNMIPVYYDNASNVWKKADANNLDASNQWYDYDNKIWANAVTVSETNRDAYLSAKVGTEVSMDDINTMWVWIPRYTYTYLNTNTPQEIQIKFESGTNSSGTIKCVDTMNQKDSDGNTISETCTDTTNNGLVAGTSTYTHPAFWWDKNDDNTRTEDEELTGIWVGKFEVSSDITCTSEQFTAADVIGSGCNLQTIRPLIKPDVVSWRGANLGTFFNGIYKMRESGNQYGFVTSDETHAMKNMEWGAVTYLSHSKYGINKEVAVNKSSTFMTGCGPEADGSTNIYETCNKYSTVLGQSASTTGNIYGIYDMSGGSYEVMMANSVDSNGKPVVGQQVSNEFNSAFTGVLSDGTSFTGTYIFPSKRYYDKYSYGTNNLEYTRGKLGDATIEMAPTGNLGNWYSNNALFLDYVPWFIRGGYFGFANNGIFYFSNYSSGPNMYYTARAVISNLN